MREKPMFQAALVEFLRHKAAEMPLWVDLSRLPAFIFLISDILTSENEKALLRKIQAALKMPKSQVQTGLQHWNEKSLIEQIEKKPSQFIVLFGESLLDLLPKEKLGSKSASGWRSLHLSSLDCQIYVAPNLTHLRSSAPAKKNLWSALKIAKAQLGIADSSI